MDLSWGTLVFTYIRNNIDRGKIKGQRLDNLDKKLKILKENFGEGNVRSELFENFIRADTPIETQEALQNLFGERIKSVRISKQPFTGEIEKNRKEMLDLGKLLTEGKDEQNTKLTDVPDGDE